MVSWSTCMIDMKRRETTEGLRMQAVKQIILIRALIYLYILPLFCLFCSRENVDYNDSL